jgi:hypothetical protein
MMPQPGIVKAVVKRHSFTSSQAGTPGLSVTVELTDDWDSGVTMVGTIWLSQKSMGMARPQLKALGFDISTHELDELDGTEILVGREVEIELREEEYKGRKELRIARFGGLPPKPTKDALKAVTAALREAKKDKPAAKPKTQKKPNGVDPNTAFAESAQDDVFPWEVDDATPQTDTP